MYMYYDKFERERQYMFYCDFKMLKESFMEMMEYYLYKLMIQIVCEVVKMVLGFNFITGNKMSMGFLLFFLEEVDLEEEEELDDEDELVSVVKFLGYYY